MKFQLLLALLLTQALLSACFGTGYRPGPSNDVEPDPQEMARSGALLGAILGPEGATIGGGVMGIIGILLLKRHRRKQRERRGTETLIRKPKKDPSDD